MKVDYIDHMGSDLTVVNAARVSFNKESELVCTCGEDSAWVPDDYYDYYCAACDTGDSLTISERDQKLIKYLATHDHFTPFTHCRETLLVDWDKYDLEALLQDECLRTGLVYDYHAGLARHSIYGWAQLAKRGWLSRAEHDSFERKYPHSFPALVGWKADYTKEYSGVFQTSDDPRFIDITMREKVPIFLARQRFKHMVGFTYNEVSRRYVDDEPEFYKPDVWRAKAPNKKQGSSDEAVTGAPERETKTSYNRLIDYCEDEYEWLLDLGVCPEQARMVLPQSMYTEYYVTGSLAAFARAYKQRSDLEHAQKEWEHITKRWDEIIRPLYPHSWEALVE